MNPKELLTESALHKRRKNIDVSGNTNLIRRVLTVSLDVGRLFAPQNNGFSSFLKWVRLPWMILNLHLQMIVVLFDKNYPTKLKAILLPMIMLLTIATMMTAVIAPASAGCFLSLLISHHLVTLFYRGSKFMSYLHQYLNEPAKKPQELRETYPSLVDNYRVLQCLQKADEKEQLRQVEIFSNKIDKYCLQVRDEKKCREAEFVRVLDAGVGVGVLCLRGMTAVLLLTIGAHMTALTTPFLTMILCCNATDLLRNASSKVQSRVTESQNYQKKMNLIEKITIEGNHDIRPSMVWNL